MTCHADGAQKNVCRAIDKKGELIKPMSGLGNRRGGQADAQLTRIGIIGAMPSEIAKLRAHIRRQREVLVHPTLTVVEGFLPASADDVNVPVCFCASGVGLVAAAMTATVLIHQFHCKVLIFIGVAGKPATTAQYQPQLHQISKLFLQGRATTTPPHHHHHSTIHNKSNISPGGLDPDLKVGDVLVVTDTVNYEMDCRAWVPPDDPDYRHARGEIPFSGGLRSFPSNAQLCRFALGMEEKGVPRLVSGLLATGSEFLTTERKAALASVWAETGRPLAVDMECAGMAQVCSLNKVPFLGLRAISDTLTGDANADFNEFTHQVADAMWPIVENVARSASGFLFNGPTTDQGGTSMDERRIPGAT